MKRYFRFTAFLGALLLCAGPVYAVTCAPQKLVHIVTVDITPGIPVASFGAQPKGLYRVGNGKLRIEESLDSASGIHEVIVVNEPNIWTANLENHYGRHVVQDPGPTYLAKAPVFDMPGLPSKLSALEFGCEGNFIAANAPTPIRSEQIGSARYDVYRVADGSDAVEILEQAGAATPAFARYYHQGNLVDALRYELYSTGLASDSDLFMQPLGVRYVLQGE
ncbi:MAG TPA: hypothetical protein VMS32_11370 [Verrucomicrobiae bacterium]|nr:hypothetical protein [Verrucomicrobiae bacterium]